MPDAHPVTTRASGASCRTAHRQTEAEAGDGAREPETPTTGAEARSWERAAADTAAESDRRTHGPQRGAPPGGHDCRIGADRSRVQGPRGATRSGGASRREHGEHGAPSSGRPLRRGGGRPRFRQPAGWGQTQHGSRAACRPERHRCAARRRGWQVARSARPPASPEASGRERSRARRGGACGASARAGRSGPVGRQGSGRLRVRLRRVASAGAPGGYRRWTVWTPVAQ